MESLPRSLLSIWFFFFWQDFAGGFPKFMKPTLASLICAFMSVQYTLNAIIFYLHVCLCGSACASACLCVCMHGGDVCMCTYAMYEHFCISKFSFSLPDSPSPSPSSTSFIPLPSLPLPWQAPAGRQACSTDET